MSIQSSIIDFYKTNKLKTGYLIIMAGQSNATDRFTISGNLNSLLQGVQYNLMTFYKTANTNAANGSWVQANPGVNTTTAGGVSGSFSIGLCIANRLINTYGKAAYIIPTAVGGTAIADAETTSWNVAHNTGVYTQDLYARMINHITQALAAVPVGITLTPVVVWIHGETDSVTQAYANLYQTNLTALINQVRTDLSLPSLKFIITKLRDDYDPTALYSATVRTADINITSGVSNTVLFDTNGVTMTLSADVTHYRPQGASAGGVMSAQNIGDSLGDLIRTY